MDDRAKAGIAVALAAVLGIGGVLAIEAVTGFRPGAEPAASIAGVERPGASVARPTSTQTTSTPSTGSASRASGTTIPTPRPKPAAPPLPTAVRITRKGCSTGPVPDGTPSGTCTTTITWKKVATEGTVIEMYGVTRCLSAGDRAGDGSCLVVGTVVPADTRKLIARAPVSKGTVSWTGPAWLDVIQSATDGPRNQAIGVDRHGDDIYFAIVVTASNEVGHSKLVIADAGTWCYDTGCEGP